MTVTLPKQPLGKRRHGGRANTPAIAVMPIRQAATRRQVLITSRELLRAARIKLIEALADVNTQEIRVTAELAQLDK